MLITIILLFIDIKYIGTDIPIIINNIINVMFSAKLVYFKVSIYCYYSKINYL